MDLPPDVPRLIGDLLRLGTIASVDLAAATCRMTIGDITTGDLPWLAGRAGAISFWSPPTVGEQALLLCPEGDHEAGIVLLGLYSTAHAAPASGEKLVFASFPDGTTLSYDADAHALTLDLKAGATATINAPGGLTLNADLTVNGKTTLNGDAHASGTISADADINGAGKSLKSHIHGGVSSGSAKTTAPV